MRQREELNKLVVMTLDGAMGKPKAIDLYNMVKIANPHILKQEKVPTFRSFVKVINAFSNIRHDDVKPKRYFSIEIFK